MTTSGFGLPAQFGNGSDGAVTTTGNLSWAAGTIKQYTTLEIAGGHIVTSSALSEATIAIFCSERMTVAGTLHLNGLGATGSVATSYGGSGGAGGANSNNYAGGMGSATLAASGIGTATVGNPGNAVTASDILGFRLRQDKKDEATISWGAKGGLGYTGTNPGGSGGYGGGCLIIFAQELSVTGTISVNGAVGNVGSTAVISSGGGGGGGGGLIWIVTRLLTNSGTIQSNGGAGGAGGTGAFAGGTGGAGLIVAETIPQ
jgi:hypothetical protein